MPFPPMPNITKRTLEVLMDAYAYLLSTDARTNNIDWILGDVGMGGPSQVPFGYISVISETVSWYSANGGMGGLAAGLDDWAMPITLTVAHEPHRAPIPPTIALPGAVNSSNPFSQANLGSPVPYQEQPGWRQSIQVTQHIKQVLRTNVTVGGAATDTRIVESRFFLLEVHNKIYRATRCTVQTQQRRIRGD